MAQLTAVFRSINLHGCEVLPVESVPHLHDEFGSPKVLHVARHLTLYERESQRSQSASVVRHGDDVAVLYLDGRLYATFLVDIQLRSCTAFARRICPTFRQRAVGKTAEVLREVFRLRHRSLHVVEEREEIMCGVLHRSPVGGESVYREVSGSVSHGSRQLRRLIHVDVVNENLAVRIEADEHAVGVGIAGVVVKLERKLAPLALRRNEVLVVCGLVILVLSLLPKSDVQACVVLIVRAESLRANLNHVCSCVCTNGGIELRSVLVRIDKCTCSASLMYAVA